MYAFIKEIHFLCDNCVNKKDPTIGALIEIIPPNEGVICYLCKERTTEEIKLPEHGYRFVHEGKLHPLVNKEK